MDQHIPNSVARLQTYIYSCLMYLCTCTDVPHVSKSMHSKWNSLSFPRFSLHCLLYSLCSPTNLPNRNWGVTLDDPSYTLTANRLPTFAASASEMPFSCSLPFVWKFISCNSLLTSLLVLTTFHFAVGSDECYCWNISVESALPELSIMVPMERSSHLYFWVHSHAHNC